MAVFQLRSLTIFVNRLEIGIVNGTRHFNVLTADPYSFLVSIHVMYLQSI